MDEAQHGRFLDYLERFEYFGRGDDVRLTREEFVAADAEFARLADMPRRSTEEDEIFKALRIVLLRD